MRGDVRLARGGCGATPQIPRAACRTVRCGGGFVGSESCLRRRVVEQHAFDAGLPRRIAGAGGDDHPRGAVFSAEGAPYYRAGRCYLRYDELYFERGLAAEVRECVAQGDADRLFALPHAQVPAVAVAVYRTPDNRFAAMQAFEYADLEYRPLTELRIADGREMQTVKN